MNTFNTCPFQALKRESNFKAGTKYPWSGFNMLQCYSCFLLPPNNSLSLFGFLLAWTLLQPCFPLTPQTLLASPPCVLKYKLVPETGPFPVAVPLTTGCESFRGLGTLKGKLVKWVGHRHHWRWLLMLRTVLVSWWSYYCCYGIILPTEKKNNKTTLRAFNWFLQNFWGTNWIEDIPQTIPYPPIHTPHKNPGHPVIRFCSDFFSFFGAWNIRLHLEFWHGHDLNVASHKLRLLSSLQPAGWSFIN